MFYVLMFLSPSCARFLFIFILPADTCYFLLLTSYFLHFTTYHLQTTSHQLPSPTKSHRLLITDHRLSLNRRRSKYTYKQGSTISVSTVALIKPPITTVAKGRWTSAPALFANAIGKNPNEATAAVISTGLRRISVPLRIIS